MFIPHKYVKDESYDPIYKPVSKKFLFKARIYPFALTIGGLFILVSQVIIPLVSFNTDAPITNNVLGAASGFSEFSFSELKTDGAQQVDDNVPSRFYLSIPALRIKNAAVETFPKSLSPDNALGHYIGSALPGGPGNIFIYGHSVLPFFYNPKNYKTIFSTLHTLNTGDSIFITYNNQTFEYKVENIEIVAPEKVDPLAEFKPKYLNEPTLTLMTCSPAGTKLRRLLVKAVIVT